jgi:ribosomal protein L32
MGHKRYIPEAVHWYVCQRCGEPRRPHRICTQHMDICAMREEDWLAKKKDDEAKSVSGNSN